VDGGEVGIDLELGEGMIFHVAHVMRDLEVAFIVGLVQVFADVRREVGPPLLEAPAQLFDLLLAQFARHPDASWALPMVLRGWLLLHPPACSPPRRTRLTHVNACADGLPARARHGDQESSWRWVATGLPLSSSTSSNTTG
jgi:hypothetical protein